MIYHFAGYPKFSLDERDIFSRLYLEYFTKTPWFNVDIFGSLSKSIGAMIKFQQQTSLNVIRLLGKRKRAFLAEPMNFNALRSLFDISENETLLDASVSDAPTRAARLLVEKAGGCVLFILSTNYLHVRSFLLNQKFVEGRDFVNAIPLVSRLVGVPIDTSSIIRTM